MSCQSAHSNQYASSRLGRGQRAYRKITAGTQPISLDRLEALLKDPLVPSLPRRERPV
jgi:hypothetical protein